MIYITRRDVIPYFFGKFKYLHMRVSSIRINRAILHLEVVEDTLRLFQKC